MKKVWLLFIFLGIGSYGFGQIKLSWELLSDVSFKAVYFEEHATEFLVPTFGQGPKMFDGKEVIVSGYFIPLSKDNKRFVLSKMPYASCFFCGASGPETIVEVVTKPEFEHKFKLDQYINIIGVLHLNERDVNHFNYILKDAEFF